jgi:hypothetical protein
MCKHWGPVVGRRGWMLCPRGVRRTDVPAEKDRWTHGSKAATLAEIRAGLAALRRRFGGRVDTGGEQVLAGFSKGASLASTLALSHPREFPLVWIHEGGAWAWTASRARRFHAGGGRALVISCGKESCARRARRGCAAARGVGLICHMLYVPGLGHSVERPFSAHAAPLFERLVARDPRWERPGTRKAGGPCTTGAQCQSGICEGPGCGPQQGRCAPRKRSCGKRLQTVCGCDLQNHRVHRGCPGIRYRGAHPCDAADR